VAQSHVHGPLWADPSRTSLYMYERIRERASYFASSIPNSQSCPWRSTHSPHAQAVCTGGRSRSRRGRPRRMSRRGGVPLSRAPARPGFRWRGVRCSSTAGWEAAGQWPRGRRQASERGEGGGVVGVGDGRRRRDGLGSHARRSAASHGRLRAALRREDADRIAVVDRPGVTPSAILPIGNGI
jgi:hypothetical protein